MCSVLMVTSVARPDHLPRSPLHFSASRFSRSKTTSFMRPSARFISTPTFFTWDDIFEFTQSGLSSDLKGFFEKVQMCNRGLGKKIKFIPFSVDYHKIGYIHNSFVDHLREFSDVFSVHGNECKGNGSSDYITLHSSLKTSQARTAALRAVIERLGHELIPCVRNELYSVTSCFGGHPFFLLERAAVPYFGIKAYAIHVNGYVYKDGQKHMWIGKRSNGRPTFPGMLDNLVAGGLPHGITCKENVLKESEEEAGIPNSIANDAISTGVVSYENMDGYKCQREILFCYDLELPAGFIPSNQDGEVDSFKLIPVSEVANIVCMTKFFKPSCALVIIDFLFRHGYFSPHGADYLQLYSRLRVGECS